MSCSSRWPSPVLLLALSAMLACAGAGPVTPKEACPASPGPPKGAEQCACSNDNAESPQRPPKSESYEGEPSDEDPALSPPRRAKALTVFVQDRNKLLRSPMRYSDGRLRVQLGEAIGPVAQKSGDYRPGVEVFRFGCGFVDVDGQVVVPPRYSDCNNFSEGLAAVALPRTRLGERRKWGVIDRDGKFVIGAAFAWLSRFSEGLMVFRRGDSYGYIGTDGTVRIAPRFKRAGPFSGGFALVSNSKDVLQVIDATGRVTAGPANSHLDFGFEFPPLEPSPALLPLQSMGRFKFQSPSGEHSWATWGHYGFALPFSEGLGPVDTVLGDGRCEYIDHQGKEQFSVKCDYPQPVSDGRIVMTYDGATRWAVYDTKGQLVFDRLPTFEFLPLDPNLDPLVP